METMLFFAGAFFIEGGLVYLLMRLLTEPARGAETGRGEAERVPAAPERKAA